MSLDFLIIAINIIYFSSNLLVNNVFFPHFYQCRNFSNNLLVNNGFSFFNYVDETMIIELWSYF